MKSSVHLWIKLQSEFEYVQEHHFRGAQVVVRYHTERLILEHEFEIKDVLAPLNGHFLPGWGLLGLNDTVIKWTTAKVHVYSESVQCLGKMFEHPEANARWEDQLKEFHQSNAYRELFGIDGEPIEFEWNIFPGITTLKTLQMIQEKLEVSSEVRVDLATLPVESGSLERHAEEFPLLSSSPV